MENPDPSELVVLAQTAVSRIVRQNKRYGGPPARTSPVWGQWSRALRAARRALLGVKLTPEEHDALRSFGGR